MQFIVCDVYRFYYKIYLYIRRKDNLLQETLKGYKDEIR